MTNTNKLFEPLKKTKKTNKTKRQNKTIQSKPRATEQTLLEHRPDVLGSGFIVQVLRGESEGKRDGEDPRIS